MSGRRGAESPPRRERQRERERERDRRDDSQGSRKDRRGGDDTKPRVEREGYSMKDRRGERARSRETERNRDRYGDDRRRSRNWERERDGGRDRDRDRFREKERGDVDSEWQKFRDRGRERQKDDDDRPSREKDIDRFRNRNQSLQSRSLSPPARDFDPKRRHEKELSPAQFPAQDKAIRKGKSTDPEEAPKEKEKPNFNQTGLLAAASNTLNTVVLKYTEPLDSRLPPSDMRYRLYTFKDGAIVGEPLNLSSQPAWLIGRDRLVADIPVDHPSCSKQHAVIQFRYVVKKVGEFGDKEGKVRPYVVDLESANGTELNGESLPEKRFVELKDGDMLKFGHSTREYILMLEKDW